jgi:carboxypeptidase PM20D1
MNKFWLIIIALYFFFFGSTLASNPDNDTIPHSAELLSRYIRHASVTGNERPAGLFFSTVARQKGFYVEVLTDEPGSFNFTASLYPLEQGKPNIVLLNHIDVVPAGGDLEHEYTYPPFSGTIADGMVWGRGAIDNKGMGIMQLLGMEYFLEVAAGIDLPFNVTLLSVSGEETGGHTGASIVVNEFLELLNPIAVYGEGGSGIPGILKRDPERKLFGISVAFKRSLWLELRLTNISSGHGAVPPPQYAVKEKVQALNRLLERPQMIRFSETTRAMFGELGKVEGGMRGLALRNIWLFRPFVLPAMRQEDIVLSLITNTATITSINSPAGAANQIPQEIIARLDCRLLPETETEDFISQIRKILDNDDIHIRILHERERTPSTQPDGYYYYFKEALEAVYPGAGVIPILAPASNDNNYFRALGIPAYGILPVFIPAYLLETIHNVDERIPVDALEKGIAVYRELIGLIIRSKYDDTFNL